MIVSHKYRFIFIKTAKTAGTSIEIALSKYLGENDVITSVSAPDEMIRRQLGSPGPQNFRVPFHQHSVRELPGAIFFGRRKRFYNHMSAAEVRNLIGDHVWNSYYKFCFERNPFDRVISLYYWCHKSEPRPSLAEFLDGPEISLLTSRGLSLYTNTTGHIVVDRVGLYESLLQDLEDIRKSIGIPEPLNLPLAKASHRTDKRPYYELIDSACREKIEARFRSEMELFDYHF